MEYRDGVPNGVVQLFKDGILYQAWRKENDKNVGTITIYKDGIAERETTWEEIDSDKGQICWIVNTRREKYMEIETTDYPSRIIYRGCYDEKKKRSGFGTEYNKDDGIETLTGFFKNGKVHHVCQSFIRDKDGMKMIEYGGEKEENNYDILDRKPIYIGGYRYDDRRCEYIRHGCGKVINMWSGVCEYESEWKDGEEVEGKRLYVTNGWYFENNGEVSVRMEVLTQGQAASNVSLCTDLVVEYNLQELVIPNNSYNNSDITELKIKNLPSLTAIRIGDVCFKSVRTVIIEGLNMLRSISIGYESFRLMSNKRSYADERTDGILRIMDCKHLNTVSIGNSSFMDYQNMSIANTPSLKSINFGQNCFLFATQFNLQGIVERRK